MEGEGNEDKQRCYQSETFPNISQSEKVIIECEPEFYGFTDEVKLEKNMASNSCEPEFYGFTDGSKLDLEKNMASNSFVPELSEHNYENEGIPEEDVHRLSRPYVPELSEYNRNVENKPRRGKRRRVLNYLTSNNFWTVERTFMLINRIRSHPELWNTNLKDYRNKTKKNNAIMEIANYLLIDQREVIRKFHNLRCQMNVELRKIKSNRNETTYRSTWEYFPYLKFLYSNKRDDDNSSEAFSGIQSSNGNEEDSVLLKQTLVVKRCRNKPKSKNKKKCIENKATHNTLEIMKKQADENTAFGEYIASELRRQTSDKKRLKMKLVIQKAIIKMAEEELKSIMDCTEQENMELILYENIGENVNANSYYNTI